MSCEICRTVGRGSVCEHCTKCNMHHLKASGCQKNTDFQRADYRCLRCGCRFSGWAGQVECPKCKHLYVERTVR